MAIQISDDQIKFRSRASSNTLLSDFLDKRIVEPGAWSESLTLTVAASAQHSLVSSSVLSGAISKGTATNVDGYMCAELAGAVGTAATTNVTSNGEILNLVQIRDASSHRAIEVNNNQVYGLLQCANGVADGAAIGATGSENVQISYVVINSDGSLSLTSLDTVNSTVIEFAPISLTRMRNFPDFWTPSEPTPRPVLGGGSTVTARRLTVTADFAANETITLATGAGETAGTATVSANANDTIDLGASATAFNQDRSIMVYLNGVLQEKGVDITWMTSGSLRVSKAMYVGEVLEIVKVA